MLGLDIGSSSVKLVRLKKDGDTYAVRAAGVVEIEQSEDDGEQLVLAKARAAQDCLRTVNAGSKAAVCSVCGSEVAVRDFRFPALGGEELENAVMLEARQVCPFNVDEATVDYHVISDGNEQTRGVLVAATNSLIDEKSQVTKRASLNCVLMDIDGLALLNCYEAWEQDEAAAATAILNIGGSWTILAIRGDDGLPFIRDITFGGDSIIQEIADENGTEPHVVRQCLGGDWSIPDFDVEANLAAAAERLIVDVSRTLRYYATQEQSEPVSRLLVCGGFAQTHGLRALLEDRLGVEAVVWNPLETMACEDDGYSQDTITKKGPALAVATGLAMRSI